MGDMDSAPKIYDMGGYRMSMWVYYYEATAERNRIRCNGASLTINLDNHHRDDKKYLPRHHHYQVRDRAGTRIP